MPPLCPGFGHQSTGRAGGNNFRGATSRATGRPKGSRQLCAVRSDVETICRVPESGHSHYPAILTVCASCGGSRKLLHLRLGTFVLWCRSGERIVRRVAKSHQLVRRQSKRSILDHLLRGGLCLDDPADHREVCDVYLKRRIWVCSDQDTGSRAEGPPCIEVRRSGRQRKTRPTFL